VAEDTGRHLVLCDVEEERQLGPALNSCEKPQLLEVVSRGAGCLSLPARGPYGGLANSHRHHATQTRNLTLLESTDEKVGLTLSWQAHSREVTAGQWLWAGTL
jgi:hypothetical protein